MTFAFLDVIGLGGRLLDPLLFGVLAGESVRVCGRGELPDALPLWWARIGLASLLGWGLARAELWHLVMPRSFDPSSHTAFFLVPGLALCALNAKWARLMVPLGLGYAAFMVARGYHRWNEIVLTALVVSPVLWACYVVPKRLLRAGTL